MTHTTMVALTALVLLGCDHGLDEAHAGHGAGGTEAHAAAHAHGTSEDEPPPLAAGENAVQAEMRLLSAALANAARTFAEPDLTPIAAELHAVHAARARTAAAIESGAYRPPAGAGRIERFLELDAAFHAELEGLVEASLANDRPRAGAALGRVVTACEGCHAEFRRAD